MPNADLTRLNASTVICRSQVVPLASLNCAIVLQCTLRCLDRDSRDHWRSGVHCVPIDYGTTTVTDSRGTAVRVLLHVILTLPASSSSWAHSKPVTVAS